MQSVNMFFPWCKVVVRGYGLRLEKLLDLLDQDDFKINNGILQRIHEAGKMDMNSFSYFS